MTQSVYVIGGAGTGKSTFTAALLDRCLQGEDMGELEDLHAKPNSRGTMITLRGHRLYAPDGSDPGLYLGCWREEFPGTDGLDRVSYIPGEEWLETAILPDYIVGEGATLAVRRFLTVLHTTTDLLLVWLDPEEFATELRILERGSTQDPKFVTATATRSRNLAHDMSKAGVQVWTIDSAYPDEWDQGLQIATDHLLQETSAKG